MELLMELLQNAVLCAGQWIVWYTLLKDNFKYNKYIVLLTFLVYVVVEWVLIQCNMQTTIFMTLAILYDYIYRSFLYKREIINSYILEFFILLMGQILPNMIIALISIGTSFLAGHSATWFSKDDLTVGIYLAADVATAVGYVITYVVCRKLKLTLMYLRGFWKYFIFFFGVILGMANCAIKGLANPDYATSPYGILFYIDMFTMCLCVIATVVILTRNLLEKREINRRITRRMEEEYRKYQRSFVLQQELRELNHEVKNQLIAKNGQVLR